MPEKNVSSPELENFLSLLKSSFPNNEWLSLLKRHEDVVFSVIVAFIISLFAILASRRGARVPGRLQAAGELLAGAIDDFVCGIMGPRGRSFTPFLGTLFIYILSMNLMGLVPFMRSSTANWSTTMALALCVFAYLQYTAFKELGFGGYFDHLLGKPRGFLAFSLILPIMMFFLHIVSELVRPLSLSLRLRSNIWGDDILLAIAANFGIGAVPLILFGMLLAIIASMVQAMVFCLLTAIYFTLVVGHQES